MNYKKLKNKKFQLKLKKKNNQNWRRMFNM